MSSIIVEEFSCVINWEVEMVVNSVVRSCSCRVVWIVSCKVCVVRESYRVCYWVCIFCINVCIWCSYVKIIILFFVNINR